MRKILLVLALVFCCSTVLAEDTLRILFLTDTHTVPGSVHEAAFQKLVPEINAEKDAYDFCVVTGDLTDMGSDAELNVFNHIFQQFKIKSYPIPGNHETCWSENACQTIDKLWGADRFEFKHDNYYCIGFSTGPYMKMGNGRVKAEDLHWLDAKLKENASDPAIRVLVFSHYPLNTGLDNWPDVTAILKKYNVAALFYGHGHRLVRHNIDGMPGFMGRPLLLGRQDPPGYNIIEIKGDQLSIIPRELGKPQGEPFAVITIGDPSALDGLAVDTPPGQSSGEPPEGVKITLVRADEASIFGGIAVVENRIFYGNSTGVMKACEYNPQSQADDKLTDVWKKQYKHSIYSTPVYADGLVVFGSPDWEVAALNAANGEQVWSVKTHSPITSDGLVADGAFYTGLGSGEFCKIDLKTGEKVWSYTGVNGRFQAAPAMGYGTIAFGAWSEHLYALDVKTGKELWTWRSPRRGNLLSPGNVVPVVSENHVVTVAPDRFMTAIDRKTGRQVWRVNDYTVREAMGTSEDGSVAYAKTMNGLVIAASAAADKFELLWTCETGVDYDHVACPLLVYRGVVYYGSPVGHIVAIDAKTGEKLWGIKRGNSQVNCFVPDDRGRVWCTMIDGRIYCIETK